MATDAHNLKQQQEVLNARKRALPVLRESDLLTRMDATYLTSLKAVSPAGLQPVLVRRNHEDWFAAYLIQQIGDGGSRLLVVEDDWRITRVKQSALVVPIPKNAYGVHSEIVEAQKVIRTKMVQLLSRVQKCQRKRQKKTIS